MFKKLFITLAITLSLTLGGTTVTMADEAEADRNEAIHFLNNDSHETLTQMSYITPKGVYMELFSGISVADFIKITRDMNKIKDYTDYRDIHFILNSPGGSAFDGLSIADTIENFQNNHGFTFHVRAAGIVASAAVPIFAVCKDRYAAPGTLFMVHEAALWKWPGKETSSDIIAQGKLMQKLQARYLSYLVENSTTSLAEWKKMEKATTWLTVTEAQDLGLIDRVNSNTGPTGTK